MHGDGVGIGAIQVREVPYIAYPKFYKHGGINATWKIIDLHPSNRNHRSSIDSRGRIENFTQIFRLQLLLS